MMETQMIIFQLVAQPIVQERLMDGIVQEELLLLQMYALNYVETDSLPQMNNVKMEMQ